MALFSDLEDAPILGGVLKFGENQFNGITNLLGKLENSAGNILDGLGNLFNTPYFLIFLLLIGGFIAYKVVA